MSGPKQPEPELPEKTRRDTDDIERDEPPRREDEEDDVGEVPTRRDRGGTDVERDAPPPGREGHARDVQERRPHRDDP